MKNYNESIEFLKPKDGQFYTSSDLTYLGIKCGQNCLVHKTVIIPRPDLLTLGSNVRIDAFNVLSGTITMGSNIHISSHCLFIGAAGITLLDYSNVAAGCKLFSASDDMQGRGMIGPTVPIHHRHVTAQPVVLEAHSCMAINSSIMPGCVLSEGSVLLANSLLYRMKTDTYSIYAGQPAIRVRDRSKEFLKYLKPALAPQP